MLATKAVFRSSITENDSKLKPDKNKLGLRPRVTTGRVIALGTSCQGFWPSRSSGIVVVEVGEL